MDVIKRQVSHLSRLIDDLLDVSRIRWGKVALRREVLDVTSVIVNAIETLQPLMDERNHELTVAMDRGNLWVDADGTRIQQVVMNLLANAAIYSQSQGQIVLSAENEKTAIVITVKDSGVGVPPEELTEIFELFAQRDRGVARSEGGLGIGLAVVKQLVELHGGAISARSDGVGKGSEFSVRLPAAPRPDSLEKKTMSPGGESGSAARVLIVEDNADIARSLARLLTLTGSEVRIALDGPTAIETARAQIPDVILLDIDLPGMDGYEVLSRLRHEESCRGAKFVAVSGHGHDEDKNRSKEAGFARHFVKPVDHAALLLFLSEIVPRAESLI